MANTYAHRSERQLIKSLIDYLRSDGTAERISFDEFVLAYEAFYDMSQLVDSNVRADSARDHVSVMHLQMTASVPRTPSARGYDYYIRKVSQ